MRIAMILALGALVGTAHPAVAQRGAQRDDRLSGRLDAATAASVQETVDAAAKAGLPTDPLILKAMEGASKGARGPQIVAAVTRLRGQLHEALAALGRQSSAAEIVAGSAALQAGVRPTTLRELRAARPTGSLATALSVLTDLVARGVPGESASRAVIELVRAGASDSQVTAYQQGVEQQIIAGLPPARAATPPGSPPVAVPVAPGPRQPAPTPGTGRPPAP